MLYESVACNRITLHFTCSTLTLFDVINNIVFRISVVNGFSDDIDRLLLLYIVTLNAAYAFVASSFNLLVNQSNCMIHFEKHTFLHSY